MTEMERDVQFLEFVVKSIVDNPEAVKIERGIDERGVFITLAVDPKDMGMVIGRQGSTAKAIRTLLRIVGSKNNARVNLKIEEPAGSTHRVAQTSNSDAKAEAEKTIDEIVGDMK